MARLIGTSTDRRFFDFPDLRGTSRVHTTESFKTSYKEFRHAEDSAGIRRRCKEKKKKKKREFSRRISDEARVAKSGSSANPDAFGTTRVIAPRPRSSDEAIIGLLSTATETVYRRTTV